MSVGQKRPIRQRVWAGDKVEARSVGENLRDVAQNLSALPKQRVVTIENQFYTNQGLVFGNQTRPIGIVNIYSETVDGTVLTSPLSGMTFDKGSVTVKFSALVVGTRYAVIRLSVFS